MKRKDKREKEKLDKMTQLNLKITLAIAVVSLIDKLLDILAKLLK